MGLEDQDKRFDEVLGRHVRRSIGEDAEAAACPSVEDLAAYHERSLSPEELAHWKEHITGCERCQEILTQLEVTEEVPLQEEIAVHEFIEQSKVLAMPRSQVQAAALKSEEEQMQMEGGAPARKPAAEIALVRKKAQRWLVPAGALAAVLLVWIAVHENRHVENVRTAPVEMAQNRPNAPSTPIPAQGLPEVPSGQGIDQLKQDSPARVPSDDAPQKAPGRSEDRIRRDENVVPPGNTSIVSSSVPQIRAESDPQQKTFQAQLDQRPDKKENEIAAASPAPPKLPDAVPAGNAPSPLRQSEGGAVSSTAENYASAEKKKATTRPEMDVHSVGAKPLNSCLLAGAMKDVAAQDSRLIVAVNGKAIWRIGAAGVIEYSSDKASAWKLQQSFVTVDLLAGSAPTEKVCWIVGRAGTVLLTTDRGDNWKQLSSPMGGDLGGVHATDALHAMVWDSTNHQSFETVDGGKTWKQTANE